MKIEREIAKRWRAELAEDDRDRKIGMLRNILPVGQRIPDLAALKGAIDGFCDSSDREVVALALEILGVPEQSARLVLGRWDAAGRPALPIFAPYTTHVFKVDLLYYLGIDRGFISGERASNQADMAYLYYLPFSMLFTSGDNLHRRTVPLFLRPDQSFAEAREFKAALEQLDSYYDQLADEIKALGVMGFAHHPPTEFDNFVADLWDRHMRPDWRDHASSPADILERRRSLSEHREVVAEVRERLDSAAPVKSADEPVGQGEPDYIVLAGQVPVQKGRWRLLPEGIEDEPEDAA